MSFDVECPGSSCNIACCTSSLPGSWGRRCSFEITVSLWVSRLWMIWYVHAVSALCFNRYSNCDPKDSLPLFSRVSLERERRISVQFWWLFKPSITKHVVIYIHFPEVAGTLLGSLILGKDLVVLDLLLTSIATGALDLSLALHYSGISGNRRTFLWPRGMTGCNASLFLTGRGTGACSLYRSSLWTRHVSKVIFSVYVRWMSVRVLSSNWCILDFLGLKWRVSLIAWA